MRNPVRGRPCPDGKEAHGAQTRSVFDRCEIVDDESSRGRPRQARRVLERRLGRRLLRVPQNRATVSRKRRRGPPGGPQSLSCRHMDSDAARRTSGPVAISQLANDTGQATTRIAHQVVRSGQPSPENPDICRFPRSDESLVGLVERPSLTPRGSL